MKKPRWALALPWLLLRAKIFLPMYMSNLEFRLGAETVRDKGNKFT